MVIEWTSPVPVWSDTLLPEPVIPPDKVAPQRRPIPLPVPKQVSRRSGTREDGTRARMSPPSSNGQQGSSSNRLPLPRQRGERPDDNNTPDGLLTSFALPASAEPSQSQKAKEKAKETEAPQQPLKPASRRPFPLPKPRPKVFASAEPSPEAVLRTSLHKLTTKDASQGASIGEDHISVIEGDVDVESRSWSVEELAEVEPMAVDFLQRYIRAFDADISTLRHAYAPYATFSLRTPSDATHRSSGLALSESKARQGPAEIAQGLSLLSSYKFCPGGIARDLHVCYDVVSLSNAAGGGILLTVHGEVFDVSRGDPDRGVAGEREGFVMLDQAFVLQRNPEWKGGGGGGEGWLLVAVSHQMVMREGDGLSEAARVGMYDGDFTWLE
ncbi:hypothetical protein FPV67DRAFT_587924 [Lyophyllum atratum]|nr:hypothetical protein FPV67DRAFT_587924 [Lyophyllum atratum]